MEQLCFSHMNHDESEIRQVVFHFMDNEILMTSYDVVIEAHREDALCGLLKDFEDKFDDTNNIIHLKWFSMHNVSSNDLKFFITKNKSYMSFFIRDDTIINTYIPYDFLKFMCVKVKNIINDYNYDYMFKISVNRDNCINNINFTKSRIFPFRDHYRVRDYVILRNEYIQDVSTYKSYFYRTKKLDKCLEYLKRINPEIIEWSKIVYE